MNPELLSWRPARADDDAFLRGLHDRTRPGLLALPPEVRGPVLDLQYRARAQGYAAQYPTARQFVLECGGERAGQMLVAEDERAVTLVDFAVVPERQGQGLGAAALTRLQAQAGDRPVHLSVVAGSPAERLYLRAGFRETGADGLRLHMTWNPAGTPSP